MLREELKCFVMFIFWGWSGQVKVSRCTPKYGVPSKWLQVAKNVCYGTKNGAYGTFTIDRDCHLYKMRLVHVSGYQSCCADDPTKRSRWGHNGNKKPQLNTIILKENKLWYPEMINDYTGNYQLEGFRNNDDVIVFKMNETVIGGTKLQVGFGRDYRGTHGNMTEGIHCIDVDISCIV